MTSLKYSPGCFGKLPKFTDFVKFNSGNNEIILFDKWLQNGLQYAKTKLSTSFDSLYSSPNSTQFIFPIQNSSNVLLGTFIPSNDKSGRKYPFIISTPFNYTFVNENPHLLPLVFEEFFLNSEKNIYKMKDMDKLDNIIAEIENKLNHSEINIPNKKLLYHNYVNDTTTNKLWNRLFGTFEDERKYLIFYNLVEILSPFRNRQINNFTLGLKIPIVSESKFIFVNISFWIDVCLRLVENVNLQPYLFWSQNPKTDVGYLTLFMNQPPYDNYTHLIDQTYLMDNICFTDKEGNTENAKKFLGSKYLSLIENKELSLADFLNII